MNYRVVGLPVEPFKPFFGLSDEDLAARGMRRYIADEKPGFPCRISLEDAEPGEGILLVNYDHQPAHSPYKASGPIFVREKQMETCDAVNTIPEVADNRLLSVRAYDKEHLICDADVVMGEELEALIRRFFADPAVDYIHVHNARRGCFAFAVERA